jgi:hypothetical protein
VFLIVIGKFISKKNHFCKTKLKDLNIDYALKNIFDTDFVKLLHMYVIPRKLVYFFSLGFFNLINIKFMKNGLLMLAKILIRIQKRKKP